VQLHERFDVIERNKEAYYRARYLIYFCSLAHLVEHQKR
jgi:hypothetical protein